MTRQDATAVARLARELAAVLEGPEPALDPNDLVRDGIGPERWFDCLVAEVDGRLIGYAMVCRGYEAHMAKRRLWLSDLYVRTDAQRTGAGHALMVENRAAGDRTRLRSRLLGSVAAQPRGQSFFTRVLEPSKYATLPSGMLAAASSRREGTNDIRSLVHGGFGARQQRTRMTDDVARQLVRRTCRLRRLGARQPGREITGVKAIAGRGRIHRNQNFRHRHEFQSPRCGDQRAVRSVLDHDLADTESLQPRHRAFRRWIAP